MPVSIKAIRKMTRKDGNAKATVVKSTKVSASQSKVTVSASRKVVPNRVKSS